MTCLAQVEIDKRARAVLRQQFLAPIFEDVVTFDVSPFIPVDLLCGGFPCQDISISNKDRRGLDGKKSKLWFEFARLIQEALPRWVLIENVSGLLSSNGGRDLGTVLGFLEERGYGWSYRVLDSKNFGVGQARRRLFIVASRRGRRATESVLFDTKSGGRHPAPRDPARASVPLAFASGARSGDLGRLDLEPWHRIYLPPLARTLMTSSSGWITQDTYLPGVDGDHPFVRRLSSVERERIQGFPDGWTEAAGSFGAREFLLGNAVTVPVAQWIGEGILAADEGPRRLAS